MELPFSTDQFLDVFRSYNLAIWPVQILAYLLALTVLFVATRGTRLADRIVGGVLSLFWIWMGAAYHLGFFSAINPAAYAFGVLFIVQGLLFLVYGVVVVTPYFPEIYPQGSFRLGTVIKPLSNADEYDVDVVCQLNLKTTQISQEDLTGLVGRDVKDYARAKNFNKAPTQGRRCWTLHYADGAQFHMDILPSVGDAESFSEMLRNSYVTAQGIQYAIAITDRSRPNFKKIDPDWLRSNPRGYAEWFKQRMQVQFERQRKIFAESRSMSIEAVPEYRIKTPLQRAIQILKRHRDIMFEHDQDDKPISIIITTLAAQAYNNEANLLEALDGLLARMPTFILKRNGVTWIPNPVNPLENFADKWQEHPQRESKFRFWLGRVRDDLTRALQSSTFDGMEKVLEPSFGEYAIREAIRRTRGPSTPTATFTASNLKRFDVPHRQSPPWPGNPSPTLRITAQYATNGVRAHFESDGEPLPKKADLHFSVPDPGLPTPYSVHWQVINTGEEARRANGLRGSIFPATTAGKGGLKQKEATLYNGSHAILCYIVRDGVCVARSREFVVNIK